MIKRVVFFLIVSFPLTAQNLRPEFRARLDDKARLHVLTFLDPECPVSQKYTNTLNRLAEKYEGQTIRFYVIISVQGTNKIQIDSFMLDYRIRFNCFADNRLEAARSLNATLTPEVFLLDKNYVVIYSGAIDDWFFDLGRSKRK